MIVGQQFIWLHFPKTAGHAVEQALRSALRRRQNILFDKAENAGWHDTVADRSRRTGDITDRARKIVCGFRRLPHWILSRTHYEASRPPYLCATREMLCRGEFYHQNGQIGCADEYAHNYGQSKVDHWIRTEHLAADFLEAFEDLIDSSLARAVAKRLRRTVNGTRLNYVRNLDFHFTADEIDRLYDANPIWAALERSLYGGVLQIGRRSEEMSYFIDRRLRFVSASSAALNAWGKSVDEVIGRTLSDVFPLVRDSEPYLAHLVALRTRTGRRLEARWPTLESRVQLDLLPRGTGLQVTVEL